MQGALGPDQIQEAWKARVLDNCSFLRLAGVRIQGMAFDTKPRNLCNAQETDEKAGPASISMAISASLSTSHAKATT